MVTPRVSRRSFLATMGAGAIGATMAFPPSAARAAPLPQPAGALDRPLRSIDKPGLEINPTPATVLQNATHRTSFYLATWNTGSTYLRKLEVKHAGGWLTVTAPDHLFDEQWVVLTGSSDSTPYRVLSGAVYYYDGTMTQNWIAFDSLTQPDADTVELSATGVGAYGLTVRWTLEESGPRLQWTIQAHQDGQYVVGYQSFDITDEQGANEVLCGARQHARFIESAAADNASELMTPMTLIERTIAGQQTTLGVFVPASVMDFEHPSSAGQTNQPYGMSLRNESNGVQPVAYAPQAGERAALAAGTSKTFAFGLCAKPVALRDAYRTIAESEYGYSDYRENIYGTSLTDAMFNILDLVMVDPPGNGTGDFVASPSNWSKRAKGFVDHEVWSHAPGSVRAGSSGVMLGAYLLTGDTDIYERRARPMLEFQLSRTGYWWTPLLGVPVPGNPKPHGLCSVPRDASTLVPLFRQTHGQNAGIRALALRTIRNPPSLGRDRNPINTPLQAYALTETPHYLAELHATARLYARDEVMTASRSQISDTQMQYFYSKAWTELLMSYETTGDEELLVAAHREALRFLTQFQLRPVPDTEITVPVPPAKYIESLSDSPALWDYPRENDDEPSETVPAWMVSTNGMSFEQLTTYRATGFTSLPVWAPFLLRLAEHTGDTFIRDTASNQIVGRYTNYPGYYYWQYRTVQMKPDFPLQGPWGAGPIYNSHIERHLGMTIDYLISEQVTRSAGQIDFPAQYEANYVFFRFRTYGHAPGRFYGDENVWLYMPKGIISVDNPQINWIVAEGNDALYVSLTNASNEPQRVSLTFDTALSGLARRTAYEITTWADNGEPQVRTVYNAGLTTVVSAKGITALRVNGVSLDVPLHQIPPYADTGKTSFHFNEDNSFGRVYGMQLVRPDRSGYDAYVQVDSDELVTLRYSTDSGVNWSPVPAVEYPNEWTIGVDSLTTPFMYEVVLGDQHSAQATLQLPPAVTGTCPPGVNAFLELSCVDDTTAGDSLKVDARLYNGGSGPLALPTTSLLAPAGWHAVLVNDPPDAIAPGAMATWHYTVTVPETQPAGPQKFTAEATWDGGSAESMPSDIDVLPSVKVLAIQANPMIMPNPGDETTLTARVVNLSPVSRTGKVTFSVYSTLGWSFTPGAIASYSLEGRSFGDVQVSLRSPTNVEREKDYSVYATLAGGDQQRTTVRVNSDSDDVFVTIADFPPFFSSQGTWLRSQLAGWKGSNTLYSSELGSMVTLRPQVTTAGSYEVSVWYPTNNETSTSALFSVHTNTGDTDVVVNQQQNARDWFGIGTFNFAAGNDGFIRLTVADGAYHRISAVRLHRV